MTVTIRPEELYGVEIYTVDNVYLRQIKVPLPAMLPQHSHHYEHLTMLVKGSVNLWDGIRLQRYDAPAGITIKAGIKHSFITLVPDVELWCIHNIMRKEIVEVLEEHHFVGVK